MQFFATLSAAALFALAAALPAQEASNIEVPFDGLPANLPPYNAPAGPAPKIFPVDPVEVEERSLAKRAFTIDVWADSDKRGRHEALWTDLNKCYELGNGWNDIISSISLGNNYGCVFYADGRCKGASLTMPANSYAPNLALLGFNDKISSYLCYH